MTWVKLDDQIMHSPKIRALLANRGHKHLAFHLAAIAHSCSTLTDGRIEDHDLPLIAAASFATPSSAKALEKAGLWDRVNGRWEIHDFLDYQEPRCRVLERREAERIKKANQRAKAHGSRDDTGKFTPRHDDLSPGDNPKGHLPGRPTGTPQGTTEGSPSVPVPSRPGTTQVVSPAGQEATRTDDDDGSKESLVIAVARARAERIRPGQTPTPQWLRSVANGLDAVQCERIRRAGSTPAEIDQALDDANDLDRIANPTRSKPTTTDEQRRPALKPVADLEQLTDQPKGDKRRNLDGIAAAREAARRASGGEA